ncbi:hypothetical protein ACHAWC_011449 [Mediolabrus comicus]
MPTASSSLILTFLSPNPVRSRSASQFLQRLFQLSSGSSSSSQSSKSRRSDILDEKHFGSSSSYSWHSETCTCNTSGTVLHFLSLTNGSRTTEEIIGDHSVDKNNGQTQTSSLALLSINECRPAYDLGDILSDCRDQLSRSIVEGNQIFPNSTWESRLRGLSFTVAQKLGRDIQPSWLLRNTPTVNLNKSSTSLDMPSVAELEGTGGGGGGGGGVLKEVALPFFPEYSTVQKDLSSSRLFSRPLPGLYQYNNNINTNSASTGLIVRPIPAATEDLRLPPPSLIFHCSSLDNVKELVERDLGGKTAKIGWRGATHRGNLIASHPSISGLDVRISEDWVLSSSFDEAEQSVLAGSLDELQSSHVMSEGKHNGSENTITADSKVNNSDCWVEVRSNMKRPGGFLKRFGSHPRVAKPPQLPYE